MTRLHLLAVAMLLAVGPPSPANATEQPEECCVVNFDGDATDGPVGIMINATQYVFNPAALGFTTDDIVTDIIQTDINNDGVFFAEQVGDATLVIRSPSESLTSCDPVDGDSNMLVGVSPIYIDQNIAVIDIDFTDGAGVDSEAAFRDNSFGKEDVVIVTADGTEYRVDCPFLCTDDEARDILNASLTGTAVGGSAIVKLASSISCSAPDPNLSASCRLIKKVPVPALSLSGLAALGVTLLFATLARTRIPHVRG